MANQESAAESLTPQVLSPEMTRLLAERAGQLVQLIETISSDGATAAEFKLEVSRGSDRAVKEIWQVRIARIEQE
jgi:hypothetical protein